MLLPSMLFFAIDPEQRIRAIIYYPMQLGRNGASQY
jgi:alkyl hydroperoxide reductase subunit AhpC